MEGILKTLLSGNLMIDIIVWVLVIAAAFVVWKKVGKMFSNDAAKELIKNFKDKRVGIMELLLVGANAIAALITSYLGEASGEVHFAARLGQHLLIAAFSAAMGFAIFDEVAEAIQSWVDIYTHNKSDTVTQSILRIINAFKQTFIDCFGSVAFAILGPVVNFYILLMYTEELDNFLYIMGGSWFNLFAWFEAAKTLKPVSFTEFWMTVFHLVGVFYLGSVSFDNLKKKYLDLPPATIPRAAVKNIAEFFAKRCGIDEEALNEYYASDPALKLSKHLAMEDLFFEYKSLQDDVENRKGKRKELISKEARMRAIADEINSWL